VQTGWTKSLGGAMAAVQTLRLQGLTGAACVLAAIMICLTLLLPFAKDGAQTFSLLDGHALYAALHASRDEIATRAPASSENVPKNFAIGEWLGSTVLTVACHDR
jgi:hypothetical protein